MVIDAHNHPDWHGHSLERFVANMDTYHIDKTWVLSWECPEDEYDPQYNYATPGRGGDEGPVPFRRCLSYVERAPDRFVLGYAPDPRKPEAVDRLRAAVEIFGVEVCGELKLRMMYDNPDALRMFRYCADAQLPVTVHIDYEFERDARYPRPSYWYGGGIEAFERAVRACDGTIFIGHAPGFWAHISGDDLYDRNVYPEGRVVPGGKVVAMLRSYPNLYCDLSAGSGLNALARDVDHAREFVTEFQDRILYGRDYFDNRLKEFLISLDLDAQILDKIYSANAQRLLARKEREENAG